MLSIIKKTIWIVIAIVASISSISAQTITRSYYCQETGTQGQVPIASQNQATYVEWYDNGTIKMFDGTMWSFRNQSPDGIMHYAYTGTTGPVMPGTQYVEAIFTSDFSMMQVNYMFGLMGMMMPMYTFYKFIGEGTQPAFDWMNGIY